MRKTNPTNPDQKPRADSQPGYNPRSEDDLSNQANDPILSSLDAIYASGPPPELTSQALKRLRQILPTGNPIYFQSLKDTPLGDLFVAVGERGLMAVDFGVPQSDFVAHVTEKTGAPPVQSEAHTQEAVAQIQDYLDGGREQFDLPVDLEALTEFQRVVLDATAQIPRGQVTSYGEIARRIGRPQAARAVGQALGKNPVPIVIPCHRVIAGDGRLGGYSGGGGLQSKTHLLRLEGAQLRL